MNFKETLEQQRAQAKMDFQNMLIDKQAWQCCLNCLNWDGSRCDMFKAVPPAHIIVTGCKDYERDIPF